MLLRLAMLFAIFSVLPTPLQQPATAETICLKASLKNGRVRLTRRLIDNGSCVRPFVRVLDTDDLPSPYGDGSAGPLVVSSSGTLLTDAAIDGNLQFTDCTISTGITLTVPSGTVLRCTGTFTNNGTIEVEPYLYGGYAFPNGFSFGMLFPSYYPAPSGVGARGAQHGELGDNSDQRVGGHGGTPRAAADQRLVLKPGPIGGGPGACISPGVVGAGGAGTVTVLARGPIQIGGTIAADGESGGAGCGGGAGGVVILASPQSIAVTGTLRANGGDGGSTNSWSAAGGGGSGGIIHLFAPTITTSGGSLSVTSGNAGDSSGTVPSAIRAGGGGGGGSGGLGGQGGDVASDNSVSVAGSGGSGVTFQTLANPTALF
jgi:hypothetical protein